jgi:hypothetical protein
MELHNHPVSNKEVSPNPRHQAPPVRLWLHERSHSAIRTRVTRSIVAPAAEILTELRAKTRRLLFDCDRWREHGAVSLALLERDALSASELRQVLYAANLRRGARD